MQQYWPILIVMAISALSWIAQRLKEQAAIKQAKDEMARRREEELRTGRAGGAAGRPQPQSGVASPEAQAMQDLAARRQAQLRELRARQVQQGQAPSGPAPIAVPTPRQASQRPPNLPHGTLRPTPLPGGTRPAPQQRPTPRPQQQRRAEPVAMPLPVPTGRVAPIVAARPVHRAPEVVPEAPLKQSQPADRLLALLTNRTTGRPEPARILVLGEILGTPPSMRD